MTGLRLVPVSAARLDAELRGDVVGLGASIGASVQEWPPIGGEWDDASVRMFRQQMDSGAADPAWGPQYVVADGRLVASAGFFGPPDGALEVEIGYSVCLAERRRGIASAVVDLLCATARRSGCQSVRARTTADNAASIAVLVRNGFAVAGEADDGLVLHRRLLGGAAPAG